MMGAAKNPGQRGRQMLRHFASHLVALVAQFRRRSNSGTPSEIDSVVYSCTLLEHGGLHFLLTAGHCLAQLQQAMRDPRVVIVGAHLVDCLGANARDRIPIPFVLEEETMMFLDEPNVGADFGVIFLRTHFVALMETNKLIFFNESTIAGGGSPDMDRFTLLGLPTELVDTRDPRAITLNPVMIGVQADPRVPDAVDADGRIQRFTGVLDGLGEMKSIAGMSGGPILGFNRQHGLRYWLVALQSSWREGERRLFACPVSHVFRLVALGVAAADEVLLNEMETP